MIYEAIDENDPLLQYEILRTAEGMAGVRGDKVTPYVRVEGTRKVVEGGTFWCCQNVTE